jgi:hypothetical protein
MESVAIKRRWLRARGILEQLDGAIVERPKEKMKCKAESGQRR